MASNLPDIALVGYPEKFELALRYGEGPLQHEEGISESDKLLLYALGKQAQFGTCKEPRPSMWDAVGKAKWSAWRELGNRSKFEAMFMYVTAVEEFAPDWWKWPELGLVAEESHAADDADTAANAGAQDLGEAPAAAEPLVAAQSASVAVVESETEAFEAVAPPLQLAPNALAIGGWSALPDDEAPARYRHACAVVGARLFVFGGRSNSGRLAPDLHQLDLLTGRWSVPQAAGTPPDLRWGHSMNSYLQWLVIFGGHRRRGCLNDTIYFDTESLCWEAPKIAGALPPARGNHSSAVVGDRLWLFGGDAANAGVLAQTVWSLPLGAPADSSVSWAAVSATGEPAPPSCDHAAVAIGSRVLLLGGSNANGYLPFSRIPIFHTENLAWSRLVCSGQVPGARAGHVAAAVCASPQGPSWQVYVFGGGNSSSGFSDLHVLKPNAKWQQLESCTAATDPASQPEATEGAAVAHSGGMLLIFGGYTAAGATKRCFAWGCEPMGAEAAADGFGAGAGGAGSATSASALGKGREPLVLMACPTSMNAQRHAAAAQSAFAERLPGAQVVATPTAADGATTAVNEAETPEQALSILSQRLQSLYLERSAFGDASTSLLSRARYLAAVQPCVYKLSAGGTPHSFVSYWVGLIDPASGRPAYVSSLSREVASEQVGWGKAARSPSDVDEDAAAVLAQAWKALLRSKQ